MQDGSPAQSEILCSTRTTTGTLVTVPAARSYTGDLCISGSISVAGTSIPVVTVNGTGAAPASGTVVGRINLTGLALTTVSDSATVGIIVRAPDGNDITIDFTPGASGTSSATLNGFLFG